MNLIELEKLADAAAILDHNEKPLWFEYSDLIRDTIFYPKNARYIAATSPQQIKAMIAVMRQMGSALNGASDATGYESHDDSVGYRVCCGVVSYRNHLPLCALANALAAYDALMKGERV